MLDPDDRDAALVDAFDRRHQLPTLSLRQSSSDFVEKQKLGLRGERARKLQSFAFKKGKGACGDIRLCD